MKTKTNRKDFYNSIVTVLRDDLKEVDCMMDDYFELEANANECGQKWFSFNEEKLRGDDELTRVSVWTLDTRCANLEEMIDGKYVWLGDLVAKMNNGGKIIYENKENRKGLIAEELYDLFMGFCGGKVACAFPKVVEVKFKI